MKTNYKKGGRVRISGKWYTLAPFASLASIVPNSIGVEVGHTGWMDVDDIEDFIEEYEPPKKKAIHEWLSPTQFDEIEGGVSFTNAVINEKLTELYGAQPIVRAYYGEEPEELGLTDASSVLYWDNVGWAYCDFCALDIGDKWIIAPTAPQL